MANGATGSWGGATGSWDEPDPADQPDPSDTNWMDRLFGAHPYYTPPDYAKPPDVPPVGPNPPWLDPPPSLSGGRMPTFPPPRNPQYEPPDSKTTQTFDPPPGSRSTEPPTPDTGPPQGDDDDPVSRELQEDFAPRPRTPSAVFGGQGGYGPGGMEGQQGFPPGMPPMMPPWMMGGGPGWRRGRRGGLPFVYGGGGRRGMLPFILGNVLRNFFPPPVPPQFGPPPMQPPPPSYNPVLPTPTDIGTPNQPYPPQGLQRWQTMSQDQLRSTTFPIAQQLVAQPESGMQNISAPNTTSSGVPRGYFQITDGTWRDFAPRAGVNLNRWPTADKAPAQVQGAVADIIPLQRWTAGMPAVQQRFPWATGKMTLGQINKIANAAGRQRYQSPPAREAEEWGRSVAMDEGPGNLPTQYDMPAIMARGRALQPYLSANVGLSNMLMLNGWQQWQQSMQGNQLMGQIQGQQNWKQGLADTKSRLEEENIDIGSAMEAYKDRPDDLTQVLGQIARKYSDGILGDITNDFPAVERLMKARDKYFVDLSKTEAAQDKADLAQAKRENETLKFNDQQQVRQMDAQDSQMRNPSSGEGGVPLPGQQQQGPGPQAPPPGQTVAPPPTGQPTQTMPPGQQGTPPEGQPAPGPAEQPAPGTVPADAAAAPTPDQTANAGGTTPPDWTGSSGNMSAGPPSSGAPSSGVAATAPPAGAAPGPAAATSPAAAAAPASTPASAGATQVAGVDRPITPNAGDPTPAEILDAPGAQAGAVLQYGQSAFPTTDDPRWHGAPDQFRPRDPVVSKVTRPPPTPIDDPAQLGDFATNRAPQMEGNLYGMTPGEVRLAAKHVLDTGTLMEAPVGESIAAATRRARAGVINRYAGAISDYLSTLMNSYKGDDPNQFLQRLRQFDPILASTVELLGTGRMAFPSGFALRSPYWGSIIGIANRIYPNLNASTFRVRQDTMRAYAVGKEGQQMMGLNVTLSHLDQLYALVDNMKNLQLPAVNWLRNAIRIQGGDSHALTPQLVRDFVMNEMERAMRGTGGSEHDIARFEGMVGNYRSPQQLHDLLDNMVYMLAGKMEGLAFNYARGTNIPTRPMDLLMPEAQQIFNSVSPPVDAQVLQGLRLPPNRPELAEGRGIKRTVIDENGNRQVKTFRIKFGRLIPMATSAPELP